MDRAPMTPQGVSFAVDSGLILALGGLVGSQRSPHPGRAEEEPLSVSDRMLRSAQLSSLSCNQVGQCCSRTRGLESVYT